MSSLTGESVEVPPGGSTEVKVTWAPDFPADPFEKSASIWTNDPARFQSDAETSDGRITLTVKGRVLESFSLEPSLVSLGTLSETEPTTFECFAYSLAEANLQVAVAKTSSEHITAEVVPVEPEKLAEKQALAGFAIRGVIQPKLPIGRLNETVTLTTSDTHKPEVTITIQARRQGPVSIAGRFWNDAYTYVDFKKFAAAQGIETTLSVYTAKQSSPLDLKLTSLKPEGLQVTATPDPTYADPSRERYLIKVQVPAGRAPERLVSGDAGKVEFETNIPEVPHLKFHIVYESH